MNGKREEAGNLVWADLMKMAAVVWIFINHLSEVRFGSPYIANPSADWPPLYERLAQLQPLSGSGFWDVPLNIWRYFGWLGDQGVQLFLIISGFGLTWGLIARYGKSPFKLTDFYQRRGKRIFPLWWGVHFIFIASFILIGFGLPPFSLPTFLSMIGLRVTPEMMYYFSPAWWYISLVIQLYLLYPVIWYGLRRWGPARVLLACCAVAFVIRLAGLFYFEGYLDAWARGSIFITRLPEFVFGVCFAVWLAEKPDEVERRTKGRLYWIALIAAYVLGNAASLTLAGNSVAPFATGVSSFLALYIFFNWITNRFGTSFSSPFVWVGKHSYSLFLVHHPIIKTLLVPGPRVLYETFFRVAVAVIATVVLALLLEKMVKAVSGLLGSVQELYGTLRLAVALVACVLLAVSILIGSELAVRHFDPQEVAGWGERESLSPDPQFGWKLVPSKTTRLRWQSYDYVVTANSFGFPGPEPSSVTTPEKFRILVTGDAFTSAEGVNTEQAWPRLLENTLNRSLTGKKSEILNFAVTGYGPNQYQAVIEEFAPKYHPDLIIVETFVNDFQDVLRSNEEFRNSIGFDQPPPVGLKSILRLEHMRRWLDLKLTEPLEERLISRFSSQSYFLGNFRALERGHSEYENEAKELFASRLQAIKSTAVQQGAKLIVVMVPAPVQVCRESQLAYYPKNVNLSDEKIFDVDLPQRLMVELTRRFDIPFYDLREAFVKNAGDCPYQQHNMHWTADGHRIASDYIADLLLMNKYVR